MSRGLVSLSGILALFFLVSCSSIYYGAMDKIGYQKRDILVSRVDKAKTAQQETKEQFANALEAYMAVVSVPGSDLESRYRRLSSAYEDSRAQAEELNDRVDAVEDVAEALFREWKKEIGEYSNRNLANESSRQLRATRKRYIPMMRAMREAEKKVEPVLVAFHDQVLFLKHNLNARAVMALKEEARSVQGDVRQLVKEMERSIAEAESFISQMNSQ